MYNIFTVFYNILLVKKSVVALWSLEDTNLAQSVDFK